VGGPIFAVLVEAGVYAAQLGFPLRPGDGRAPRSRKGVAIGSRLWRKAPHVPLNNSRPKRHV